MHPHQGRSDQPGRSGPDQEQRRPGPVRACIAQGGGGRPYAGGRGTSAELGRVAHQVVVGPAAGRGRDRREFGVAAVVGGAEPEKVAVTPLGPLDAVARVPAAGRRKGEAVTARGPQAGPSPASRAAPDGGRQGPAVAAAPAGKFPAGARQPGGKGPVVVIVMTHRAPAQIARLVKRLTQGADTVVAIHHDPTGEPLRLSPHSQVITIPDAMPVEWGRLSLAQAQWRSLRWVADRVPDFSWVLLISGQDYPIRRMTEIERELQSSSYDAYLRHFLVGPDPTADVHPWQDLTRRRYLYRRRLPCTYRSVYLPFRRRHPYRDGTELYVGDMWFNLSAKAVGAMIDSGPLAEKLFRYLRFSPIPDESFLCSMALNARPPLDVATDGKRFIRWKPGSAHPEPITPETLPALRESTAYFARKLDDRMHPDVPDLLDALADERAGAGSPPQPHPYALQRLRTEEEWSGPGPH